jgi:hypothetical protein
MLMRVNCRAQVNRCFTHFGSYGSGNGRAFFAKLLSRLNRFVEEVVAWCVQSVLPKVVDEAESTSRVRSGVEPLFDKLAIALGSLRCCATFCCAGPISTSSEATTRKRLAGRGRGSRDRVAAEFTFDGDVIGERAEQRVGDIVGRAVSGGFDGDRAAAPNLRVHRSAQVSGG